MKTKEEYFKQAVDKLSYALINKLVARWVICNIITIIILFLDLLYYKEIEVETIKLSLLIVSAVFVFYTIICLVRGFPNQQVKNYAEYLKKEEDRRIEAKKPLNNSDLLDSPI